MNKRLIAIICTSTLVAQVAPITTIASTIEQKSMVKELNNSDKINDNKKETSQNGQLEGESNSIDKNKIIFNGNPGEVIGIGFDSKTKKLKIETHNRKFNNTGNISGYVTIEVYGKDGKVKVPKISVSFTETVDESKLQALKDYTFEYGDNLKIYHGHPFRFAITGGVIDEKENYADGVQNPENLLNTKFEITQNGLKAVYKDQDEERIANNNIVFGPLAREKYPFKIQIDFKEKRFKVVETTATQLVFGDTDVVYKIVLMDSNKNIKRETTFKGTDIGSRVMSTTQTGNKNNKNWNNQQFEYGDYIYISHQEESRSIIKGNIKDEIEKYSDDLNDTNNGVFKLTKDGLESVYKGAPEIMGADDIDVYVGERFDLRNGIVYSDTNATIVKTSILGESFTTQVLGEYIVPYIATNSWGITTVVNRKITVRPYLYKNVFKIYSQINTGEQNIKSGQEFDDNTLENENPWQYEENKNRKPVFEIGFDTVSGKYRVFNQSDEQLSKINLEEVVVTIKIKNRYGETKEEITLIGSDKGTSSKLMKLNDLKYELGDMVNVVTKDVKDFEVSGDVERDQETIDYMQGEYDKKDCMVNTRFIVTSGGLQAKYNKGAQIQGVEDSKTVNKGNSIDLLQGITVSDEVDQDVSISSIKVSVNDKPVENKSGKCDYTFNESGTYKVRYEVSDSWGRTTTVESTINVN